MYTSCPCQMCLLEAALRRSRLSSSHIIARLLFYALPQIRFCGGGGGVYCVYFTVCLGFSPARYFLNCAAFCNQTWYGGASSRTGVSCEKIAIFKVKVTVRARVISQYIF